MARSNAIWTIHFMDEGIVRMFTVKHECASWLHYFALKEDINYYWVGKYPDNQSDSEKPNVMYWAKAEDFLKGYRFHE